MKVSPFLIYVTVMISTIGLVAICLYLLFS